MSTTTHPPQAPTPPAQPPLGSSPARPHLGLMSGGALIHEGGSLASRLDASLLALPTAADLGPIPQRAGLPVDPAHQGPLLGGELPLDVADFVTDYSMLADLDQQRASGARGPHEALRLEKDLQSLFYTG